MKSVIEICITKYISVILFVRWNSFKVAIWQSFINPVTKSLVPSDKWFGSYSCQSNNISVPFSFGIKKSALVNKLPHKHWLGRVLSSVMGLIGSVHGSHHPNTGAHPLTKEFHWIFICLGIFSLTVYIIRSLVFMVRALCVETQSFRGYCITGVLCLLEGF